MKKKKNIVNKGLWWLSGKESACSMNRGAWWATVHFCDKCYREKQSQERAEGMLGSGK